MGTVRRGGGPSNLRIVSGGIPSLTAISSAVGSRPITCRKFRYVRKILLKAAMVATEKLLAISVPRSCPKYDLTGPVGQAAVLSYGCAVHRIRVRPRCGILARMPK